MILDESLFKEGYTPEEYKEIYKLAKEIGIDKVSDLERFKQEPENVGKDLLVALREYRANLGDDFKLSEALNQDSDEYRFLLNLAQGYYETGHGVAETYQEFERWAREENIKPSKQLYGEYLHLINDFGPQGFYEQFRDVLDFDPDFAAEFGDLDESLNEDNQDSDNNLNIKIEVYIDGSIQEGVVSGRIEDKYDEQTLEDWYEFASTVEGLVEKDFIIKNISLSKNPDSLSEYIDFYRKDENGQEKSGLIDLRLSDYKATNNSRRLRKEKVSKLDPYFRLISVIVNDKKFDSYDEALEYIGKLLQPLNESLNEDTVKQDGKWVNKGDEGTHGKFNTKKEADAQRKAMYANGFGEDLQPEKKSFFVKSDDGDVIEIRAKSKNDAIEQMRNFFEGPVQMVDNAGKEVWKVFESLEEATGDEYIQSSDANFEKDKEAERQAKVELAKNGVDAISEGAKRFPERSSLRDNPEIESLYQQALRALKDIPVQRLEDMTDEEKAAWVY